MEIIRKTIENDEEYLRSTSIDVDFNRDNYMEYINALEIYCKNNAVFALAPIQIGMPKRLIYIKNTSPNMSNNYNDDYSEGIVYINPTIISRKGLTRFLEGCASCKFIENDRMVYYVGLVDRPFMLEIEYYDLQGVKRTKNIEGFEATIFCHEYDHLNGVLHMDRSYGIFKMTLEEMKDYRLKNPYEIISKTCDYEDNLVRKRV